MIRPSAIPEFRVAGRPTATTQLRCCALAANSSANLYRSLSAGGVIAYYYTTGVAGTASVQAWLSGRCDADYSGLGNLCRFLA